MKKQRKKPSVIHLSLQKDYDMIIQKKEMQTAFKPKSKGIKRHRASARRKAVWMAAKEARAEKLQTAVFCRAVERSVATTQKSGNPVARYDVQRRQAYLEYPDGTKTYVE